MRALPLALAAVGCLAAAAGPAAFAMEVVDATVPPAAEKGVDLPLTMRIDNKGGGEDSLVRVRCPVAQFTEKRTVDQGEGGTAHREVTAIPVPADGDQELGPEGFHVVLLQTTQPLRAGESFSCAFSFKVAGPRQVPVTVRAAAP